MRVSSKTIKTYKEPDEYAYLNVGDKDLQMFRVPLPVPEKIEKVTNYGLLANDQVFFREEYPLKLKYLEEQLRSELEKRTELSSEIKKEQAFSEEIWKKLHENYDKYKEEIDWIRRMWHYRLYGKWFFINGKPTYITGEHWYYLNWWHLEGYGLPDYRDRDRRWFLAQEYLKNTQEAPKVKENGKFLYNADDTLYMEDTGSKTVYGSNSIKSRQVGETSKVACSMTEFGTRTMESRCGIQAESGDGAGYIFRWKIKFPFFKLPFIFRPTVDSLDPGESLNFKSKKPEYGIDASIDHAPTVYRNYYDKENLDRIHIDEAGKLDPRESVKDRHEVLFKCMEVRGGFMYYTSTVEEMDKSAGKEFLELTKKSHFQERDGRGQTSSGLVNIFFPSFDGHKFFIGKFGESVTDNPTREQLPYIRKVKDRKGNYMGARQWLLSQRADLEKKGDIKGLISAKRLDPMSLREAFTPPAKGEFFNRHIIENRMGELQMGEADHLLVGDFDWTDETKTAVRFNENKGGRFVISERLKQDEANKIVKQRNIYRPNNNNKYILCADAFKAEKVEGGKMSDGGGAVLKVYDKNVDPPDKNVKEWDTHRFVCTYLFRPNTVEEYVEDMLKMCVYYGAMCYPENNVNHVEMGFRRLGYAGYLLYGYDKKTNKVNKVPGFNANYKTKPELFNRVRDWVQGHGERCDHPRILEQVSEIRGLDDMTNYDLFTSVAGCLYGEEILINKKDVQEQMQGFDVGGIFKKRTYV